MKKLLLMTFSIMCSTFSKSIRPMIFLYRFSGLSSILTYLKKTYIYKKIKAMWTLHKLIILIKNRIFKFYNDFGNCLSFYFSFILFSLFLLCLCYVLFNIETYVSFWVVQIKNTLFTDIEFTPKSTGVGEKISNRVFKMLNNIKNFVLNLIGKEMYSFKYKLSFTPLTIFIVESLGIKLPENSIPIIDYCFGIFLLSIVVLSSFIRIVLTLLALNYLKDSKIEMKLVNYPRLIKILKYYEKTSRVFLVFEIVLCLVFIIIIVISSLLMTMLYIKLYS